MDRFSFNIKKICIMNIEPPYGLRATNPDLNPHLYVVVSYFYIVWEDDT